MTHQIFPWHESYATGIAEVDRQHFKLVAMINQLSALRLLGGDVEEMRSVVASLRIFADEHFRDEEMLMFSEGIDNRYLLEHMEGHRQFSADVMRFAVELGHSDSAIGELLRYLLRWLADHIIGEDSRMARELLARQQGQSSAEAARTAEKQSQRATEALFTLMTSLYDELGQAYDRLRQTSRDMSEARQSEEMAWRMANFDPLTGLPNRRWFHENLGKEISRAKSCARSLAVLFIDLDKFKSVNDTLGHAFGDALLAEAAQRITKCLRTTDTVSRLGGDEFIVIAPMSDSANAARVARKIVDALEQPFKLTAGTAEISASIGIALFPDHADSPEQLLHLADDAMYVAKAQGRNGFAFAECPVADPISAAA